MKATAILVVEAIEPSRQFFCERLGFNVVVEVPHGEFAGFSLLQNGQAEIMLQTQASVRSDMSRMAGETFKSIVYVDVPDVASMDEALRDYEELVALRTTFYGANERFVREPGGNVVGLSSPA